jgi:hypothetical protein
MAAADKVRYEREMKSYVPAEESDGGSGGDDDDDEAPSTKPSAAAGKKRKKKDPNAPKKPLTAFFRFSRDERPRLKAEQPELSFAELTKLVGQKWKELSTRRTARNATHTDASPLCR